MDGKGFEPTVDALFGKNGFFPDTVSKALYWAEDKMPNIIKDVLEKWVAPFKSEGHKVPFFFFPLMFRVKQLSYSSARTNEMNLFSQVPENLMREVVHNFNKLVRDLQNQESPEAMAYLRIMGTELGFIKSRELKSIAENAFMYADIFLRIIPSQVICVIFVLHYIQIFAMQHLRALDSFISIPSSGHCETDVQPRQ